MQDVVYSEACRLMVHDPTEASYWPGNSGPLPEVYLCLCYELVSSPHSNCQLPTFAVFPSSIFQVFSSYASTSSNDLSPSITPSFIDAATSVAIWRGTASLWLGWCLPRSSSVTLSLAWDDARKPLRHLPALGFSVCLGRPVDSLFCSNWRMLHL